jgi:hypothetical protein
VDLTGGPNTLLVLPDEQDYDALDLTQLGSRVEFARVPLPATVFPYRYRLVASIILAESARQIGSPTNARRRPTRLRRLSYESAIEPAAVAPAVEVTFQELRALLKGVAPVVDMPADLCRWEALDCGLIRNRRSYLGARSMRRRWSLAAPQTH